jgi:hypothetical protein
MSRNKIMGAIGGLSLAALVAAAIGAFRVFSYLSIGIIVGSLLCSSIERWGRELDLSPYRGLAGGLLATFLVGVTAIWVLWSPGQTEFTYVLGLPSSTFAYLLFIWILPLFGTLYYAISLFPTIGSDDVVERIMADAREAQSGNAYPLTPERTESSVSQSPAQGGDD